MRTNLDNSETFRVNYKCLSDCSYLSSLLFMNNDVKERYEGLIRASNRLTVDILWILLLYCGSFNFIS